MQLLGFWNFFVFFRFFLSKLVYFWTKSRKKRFGCFFHSICATDLNFGTKNIERTKLSTLKTLIFSNFWGPEVVGCSSCQKNIGAKFTHLYIPSLCKEFVVMRHNLGHPTIHTISHNVLFGSKIVHSPRRSILTHQHLDLQKLII